MTVSLTKGGNVNLTKQAGGVLKAVAVELGWDPRKTSGEDFDLDASAIMAGADNKVLTDQHFVFFNNLTSPDGTVKHLGDNLTGSGDGADEVVTVDLEGQDSRVEKIVFPVSIYDAENRGQTFGQVSRAFIRVVDQATKTVLANFDLSEDASGDTCMVFGELYRDPSGAGWKFKAVGQGYADGLAGLARANGVNVG